MDEDGHTSLRHPTKEKIQGECSNETLETDARACDQCKKLTTYDTLMKLKSGEKFHHGSLETLIENSGNLWSDFTMLEEPWSFEAWDSVIFKTRPMSDCLLCWEMVHSITSAYHLKSLSRYDLLHSTITLEMIDAESENQFEAPRVLILGDLELHLMHGDELLLKSWLCFVGNRSKCGCIPDDSRMY